MENMPQRRLVIWTNKGLQIRGRLHLPRLEQEQIVEVILNETQYRHFLALVHQVRVLPLKTLHRTRLKYRTQEEIPRLLIMLQVQLFVTQDRVHIIQLLIQLALEFHCLDHDLYSEDIV